ncbi:MAG: class I SAM-dependent methyltransferase [Alphaproteobacteria bacterium]|nr:class I SAM-dependent methyltransferase [Alphaproteobacteria bacterium]
MSVCKICGNKTDHKTFQAREMLRGTRRSFDYRECSSCGCVQLVAIPSDIADYYANDSYGSFSTPACNGLKKRARIARNKFSLLRRGGLAARVLNRLAPLPPDCRIVGDYARLDSKILDIGCGRGAYINDLADIGFKDVSGIDPFLKEDIVHPNGVVVRRMFVQDVTDRYDVILSHHSFEHVPNPYEFLSAVRKILAPDGVCLLTVPVAEDLYRRYGKDCYLIQAPQHFFLYSIKAFEILARKSKLRIDKIMRFSEGSLAWHEYSVLWSRDIVSDETGKALDRHFTAMELAEFRAIEAKLAAQGKGDNVTFVLTVEDAQSEAA